MPKTDVCRYCGQTIELADDGAWQDTWAHACGCGDAIEAGDDRGEHQPESDTA